jgi:hypothetical protein
MKIPVSIGEVVDKITILSIKGKKIENPEKLFHIRKELDLLREAIRCVRIDLDGDEVKALENVNLKLWDLENAIRANEKESQFGDDFIQTARAIYRLNDERTRLKRKINLKYQSDLIEEKEYGIP